MPRYVVGFKWNSCRSRAHTRNHARAHILYASLLIKTNVCAFICLFACAFAKILTSVLNGVAYDIGWHYNWDDDVGNDHCVDNIHVTWWPICRRGPSPRQRPSNVTKGSSAATKMKWTTIKKIILCSSWTTSNWFRLQFWNTIFPDDCFSSKEVFIGQWNPISFVGEIIDFIWKIKYYICWRYTPVSTNKLFFEALQIWLNIGIMKL